MSEKHVTLSAAVAAIAVAVFGAAAGATDITSISEAAAGAGQPAAAVSSTASETAAPQAAVAVPGKAAQALPQETVIFIDVPNLPEARAQAGTAYTEIMSEEQVRKFIAEGFPALAELTKDVEKAAGRKFEDVAAFCKGEAAVALVPSGDATQFAFVAMMDVGADPAAFEEFVSSVAAQFPATWQEEQIPGATVKWTQVGMARVSYAVAGNFFVLSSSLERLKEAVAGLSSPPSRNLAGDATFAKCLELQKVDKPELVAFVSFNGIKAQLLPMLPPFVTDIYGKLGLDGLAGALYSSRAAGKGFMDSVALYFPEKRAGVFGAVEPEEGGYEKNLSIVPTEVLSASWTSIDAAKVVDAAAAVFEMLPPFVQASIGNGLDKFQAESGVNLRDDVLGSLGHNLVSYTPVPTPMMGLGLSGGFGQQVWFVELKDAAKFVKSLDAMWKYGKEHEPQAAPGASSESTESALQPQGGEAPPAEAPAEAGREEPGVPAPQENVKLFFETETFANTTIYQLRIVSKAGVQVVPSVAVVNGRAVVSSDTQSVKNIIGAPEKPERTLFDNPDYMAAARMAGPANAGASYMNTRLMFETAYQLVAVGLPMIMSQLPVPAPIDQALLPEQQAVVSHLYGSASAVNATDNAILMSSYGPVGLVRTAYLAGVGGGALLRWAQESGLTAPGGPGRPAAEGQPGAPSAVEPEKPKVEKPDSKRLAEALFMYAQRHEGEYPPDLETLVSDRLMKQTPGLPIDFSDWRYVKGLTALSDKRLILLFERAAGPSGRSVILAGGEVMTLTDDEIAQQVGGWLNFPENPTDADKEAACLKNLEVLAESVRLYASLHNGALPTELDVRTSYRFAPLVLTCPAATVHRGADYGTVVGANIEDVPDPVKPLVLLVYEKADGHGGKAGATFLDGTTKSLTPEELKKAIDETRIVARRRPKETK